MGLLGWFRRSTPEVQRNGLSTALIQETTDYLVRMTDPRLTLVARYRERLAPAVEATLAYLRHQRERLPAPRTASTDAWANDPCLKAMFVTAQDVERAVSGAGELCSFFARAPLQEEAHAVLGMKVNTQRVLGMALNGEVVQRDVVQTTLSFSDHRLRLVSESPHALWRAIVRRLLDEFAVVALTRMQAEQQNRKSLETDSALLRARLRTFERRGAGIDSFLADTPGAGSTEARKLLHQLEDNERKLNAHGGSVSLLERQLELLREVLLMPAESLEIERRQHRVDSMNRVLRDDEPDGALVEYDFVRIKRIDQNVERAFLPVRVPRPVGGPCEQLRFDEAERLLG